MKELKRASLVFALFFVITGLGYPFLIRGLSRLLFPAQANGSLLIDKGQVVGSALIGQRFTSPGYFHGRPSAIDYDASNSGGTNFGPANGKLLAEVNSRIEKARAENGMGQAEPVPADLVLASASGLDPDISLDAALLQVPRIARARGMSDDDVKGVVTAMANGGYAGAPMRINVLRVNLALDGWRAR
jgi:K+-transporting ATPase ATPase C chain